MDLFVLSERVLARQEAVGFDRLRVQEKNFAAIWELESEVHQGGFEHYFETPAADHALHVPPALMEIGAHEAAAIVAVALGLFSPVGPPAECEERREALHGLDKWRRWRLEELGAQFLAYPEPLRHLLEAYVSRKAEVFSAQSGPGGAASR
jgi:hypothetical protein